MRQGEQSICSYKRNKKRVPLCKEADSRYPRTFPTHYIPLFFGFALIAAFLCRHGITPLFVD